MKLLSALLLATFTLFAFAEGTQIVSVELVENYTIEELEAAWKKGGIPKIVVPINNEVDVYEIVYLSTWHDGSTIEASGLYFVPKVDHAVPTVVYHHGTKLGRERQVKIGGEQAICVSFATDGYAVIMPDYFGIGKSDKRHPYVHRESEARASVDMLKAVVVFNNDNNISISNQLFLTGYSQGGHACMATHMMLQQEYGDEFTVTASSPMSGPYNISGVQGQVMFRDYDRPGYLPYMLFGYNEAYGFVDDPTLLFRAPYDSLLPARLDGYGKFSALNKGLPSRPVDMLKQEIVDAFVNNPDHYLWEAIKDNDVHDWKPESPTMMCYCKADEQVDYRNALVTYDVMTANGATKLRLKHAGKKFNHSKCAMYTTIYTKFWFDSFVKGSKKGKKGPVFKRMLVSMSKIAVKGKMRKKARKKRKAAKK